MWTLLEYFAIKEKFKENPHLLGGYPCHVGKIYQYRSIWRKEFKVSDKTMTIVKKRLRKNINVWKKRFNKDESSADPIVVTVHVRRTDYIKHLKKLGGNIVGKSYFASAFAYLREK